MKLWLQGLVVSLALVAALAPIDTATVERRFSVGIYPAIQRVVTPIANAAPFALFDLLTIAAAAAVIVVIARGIRRARKERHVRPLLHSGRWVVVCGAAVYLVFLALWGFNYRRMPMSERLLLDRAAPSTDAVVALGLDSVQRLNTLYAQAHGIGWPAHPWDNDPLRAAFAGIQQRLSDAPPAVPGRLKRSVYGPYFRWTSVDGMVNPFALEVIENPDLLPFERPMVAAHEWAHLAGYANEAEANFVGWLTCVRADAPSQYSGWLHLYWEVAGELSPDGRTRLWEAMEEGPRRDVQAMVERVRRGQLPALRTASWRVYDHYLRANRVQEGVRSYGEVVTLILRARFDDAWTPVRRHAPSR